MGGIIPPIIAKICIVMSSRKLNLRGLPLPLMPESLSRSHCKILRTYPIRLSLSSPLWLCLYRLDFAICNSGYFARRRLLRLRNDLLSVLGISSGNAWYVGCGFNPKTKESQS